MKKYNESLLKKPLLAIIIIALSVPAAFFLSYNLIKAHAKNAALRDIAVIAESYRGRVCQFLEMTKRRAQDFASDGFIKTRLTKELRVREVSVSNLSKYLAENKITLDESIKTIHVLSMEGRVVASTDNSEIGKDLSGETFFIKGKDAIALIENTAVHDGLPELAVSAPIFSMSKKKATVHPHLNLPPPPFSPSVRGTGGGIQGNNVYSPPLVEGVRGGGELLQKRVIGVLVNTIRLSELNKMLSGEYHMEDHSILLDKERWKSIEVYLVNRDKRMIINFVSVHLPPLSSPTRGGGKTFPPPVPLTEGDKGGGEKSGGGAELLPNSIFAKDAVLKQIVNTLPVTTGLTTKKEVAGFYKDYRGIVVAGASKPIPQLEWVLLAEIEEDEILSFIKLMLMSASIAAGIIIIPGIVLFITLFKTERMKAENTLEKQSCLTALSADIGVALVQHGNLRDILQKCAEALVKNLDVLFARIWTFNKETNMLELQSSAGIYPHTDSQHSRIPVGMFKAGLIAEERKPYLTNSVIGDPKVPDQEWARQTGMVSYADYPLTVDDRLVGVMAIFAQKPITEVTLKALTSVSDSIALGIDHNCLKENLLTEKKRREEEQNALREQLYHSQKLESVGTLAGGIAHDFNNILAIIIGYGNLLEKSVGKGNPSRFYIQKILKSAERATNLVQGLLAFSRKQGSIQKPVPINRILFQVKTLLSGFIGEDIVLDIVPANKDCIVMADSDQMEQVLINLATNARDAMPRGGTLTITTKVVELDDVFIKVHGYGEIGKYVLISVKDMGTGMDKETQRRIFIHTRTH